MEWINFRHLYSFWMVNRSGGFKNASEVMRVSQSTVSEQVSSLEEYLKAKLFHRTTRSLQLTDFGMELVKKADKIFKESLEINSYVDDPDLLLTQKRIRIGLVGGVSRNLVFRFLKDRIDHDVNFEVYNGAFEDMLLACKKSELDLIISTDAPREMDAIHFHSLVLESSPICLAAKGKVLSALVRDKKKKNTVREKLEGYIFNHPDLHDKPLAKFEDEYKCDLIHKLKTEDISLLRFFANSGEGVAILPQIGIQEDIDRGLVEMIPLSHLANINFHAVYAKGTLKLDYIEKLLA